MKDEATETAGGPSELMPHIGQLIFQWSNSQSLLIRLLALMLEIDGPSAAVIFSTLGTTHLRMDLVRRLSLLKVVDREMRDALGKILDDFDEAGRVRNELVYAMYPVNDQGEITHTEVMRFVSKADGGVTFGESHAIDRKRVADIVVACDNLRFIARALEHLMPNLQQAIASDGLELAAD